MEDKSLKKFVQETIETTVKQVVCASHGCRLKEGKNIYKQTEARLYAYPTLLANIERYKLDIEDLKKEKVTKKSKDITSWSGNSGVRLTPEEKQLGKIMSVQIKLERDQKEVDEISAALEFIAADYYKPAVVGRYIDNATDIDIAQTLLCDERTVRRHRSRLVRQMSLFLYGAEALE